jgi:hypothetical protein
LRSQPHTLVGVAEQFEKLFINPVRHPFREKFLRFPLEILVSLLRSELVDACLAGATPTLDPVEHIQTAIRSEFHVGRQDTLQQNHHVP